MNDSAAAVLLLSEAEVTKRSIKPLARIVGFAQTGMEPEIMGMGAASAVQKLVSSYPIIRYIPKSRKGKECHLL